MSKQKEQVMSVRILPNTTSNPQGSSPTRKWSSKPTPAR